MADSRQQKLRDLLDILTQYPAVAVAALALLWPASYAVAPLLRATLPLLLPALLAAVVRTHYPGRRSNDLTVLIWRSPKSLLVISDATSNPMLELPVPSVLSLWTFPPLLTLVFYSH